MPRKVSTCLMFDGAAEEAMNLYVSIFGDSQIVGKDYYKAGEGPEGKIKGASFTIGGQNFVCTDSPEKYDFGFTPAISIFVHCESDEELQKAFATLSDGGTVLMPLAGYGFSAKFGWVTDRFGVSWQLNLA